MNAAIAARRLRNQLITHTGLSRPAAVVSWQGAVQAQEYEAAKWGLALRMREGVATAIERDLDAGRILRTHVMRPTWHFVAAADIRWLLELTGPRVQRVMSSYNRRLGLDADVLTRTTAVIERILAGGRTLTRQELRADLARAGYPLDNVRLAHAVMHAELEGVIGSGPRLGNTHTYALLAERAAGAPRLPREEAIAALARRYFKSHGPATVRDFVWWSGLTTGDAKRGLEMIRARREDVDGRSYWTVGPAPRGAARARQVLLLPIYDEYLIAYRDREAVPHGPSRIGLPAAFATFQHALVIAGQVAGTWRITRRPGSIGIEVVPVRRLTRLERRALDDEVTRFERFLGVVVQRTRP